MRAGRGIRARRSAGGSRACPSPVPVQALLGVGGGFDGLTAGEPLEEGLRLLVEQAGQGLLREPEHEGVGQNHALGVELAQTGDELALDRHEPQDRRQRAHGNLQAGQRDGHVVGRGGSLEVANRQRGRERSAEGAEDRDDDDVATGGRCGRSLARGTGGDLPVEAQRHQGGVLPDEVESADDDEGQERRRAEQDVAEAAQLRVLEVELLVAVADEAPHAGAPDRRGVGEQLPDGEAAGVVAVQGRVGAGDDERDLGEQLVVVVQVEHRCPSRVHVPVGSFDDRAAPPVGEAPRDRVVPEGREPGLVDEVDHAVGHHLLRLGEVPPGAGRVHPHLELVGLHGDVLDPDALASAGMGLTPPVCCHGRHPRLLPPWCHRPRTLSARPRWPLAGAAGREFMVLMPGRRAEHRQRDTSATHGCRRRDQRRVRHPSATDVVAQGCRTRGIPRPWHLENGGRRMPAGRSRARAGATGVRVPRARYPDAIGTSTAERDKGGADTARARQDRRGRSPGRCSGGPGRRSPIEVSPPGDVLADLGGGDPSRSLPRGCSGRHGRRDRRGHSPGQVLWWTRAAVTVDCQPADADAPWLPAPQAHSQCQRPSMSCPTAGWWLRRAVRRRVVLLMSEKSAGSGH